MVFMDAALTASLRTAATRRALEAARVERTPGERMLLALSERRADNAHASSRALVERLSGHRGLGESSRTARLTIVNK